MNKVMTCRACGRKISFSCWNSHIEDHKKEFCHKFEIPKTKWRKIRWETIVETLNPSQAKKPKKIAAQEIIHGQKTLNQNWREQPW